MGFWNRDAIVAAATGFRAVFASALRAGGSPIYARFCEEVTSAGSAEEFQFAPLGLQMREWEGARRIHRLGAFRQTITPAEYEGSFAVPRTAIEDDKLGHYSESIRELAIEAMEHPEDLFASLLSNGFPSGTTLAYDAVSFFNNAHLTGDGSNDRDNYVNAALAASSFQEATRLLSAMKAYNGRPLRLFSRLPRDAQGKVSGLVLMVPAALQTTAEGIVKDYNDSGASNIDARRAEVLVNPFLDAYSSTKWYLGIADGVRGRPVTMVRRLGPDIETVTDGDSYVFLNNEIPVGVRSRYGLGARHFESLIGGAP